MDLIGAGLLHARWLLRRRKGSAQPVELVSHGCPPTRHRQIQSDQHGEAGVTAPRSLIAPRSTSRARKPSDRSPHARLRGGRRDPRHGDAARAATRASQSTRSPPPATTTTRCLHSQRVRQAQRRRHHEPPRRRRAARAVQAAEALAKLDSEDAEGMPGARPQQYEAARAWTDTTAGARSTGPRDRRARSHRAVAQRRVVATGYLEAKAAVPRSRTARAVRLRPADRRRAHHTVRPRTAPAPAGPAPRQRLFAHRSRRARRARDREGRACRRIRRRRARALTRSCSSRPPRQLGAAHRRQLSARSAAEGRSFFAKPAAARDRLKVVDERSRCRPTRSPPRRRRARSTARASRRRTLDRRRRRDEPRLRPLLGAAAERRTDGRSAARSSCRRRYLARRDDRLDRARASRHPLLYIRRRRSAHDPLHGAHARRHVPHREARSTRAVKNLRFNESPIFMLNNVEAMGRPVRVSASGRVAASARRRRTPLKVPDFNFTSPATRSDAAPAAPATRDAPHTTGMPRPWPAQAPPGVVTGCARRTLLPSRRVPARTRACPSGLHPAGAPSPVAPPGGTTGHITPGLEFAMGYHEEVVDQARARGQDRQGRAEDHGPQGCVGHDEEVGPRSEAARSAGGEEDGAKRAGCAKRAGAKKTGVKRAHEALGCQESTRGAAKSTRRPRRSAAGPSARRRRSSHPARGQEEHAQVDREARRHEARRCSQDPGEKGRRARFDPRVVLGLDLNPSAT